MTGTDKTPSSSTSPSPIHPALTISNISSFLKITLDAVKGPYTTWAELFKIHATAFQALDHIIPSTDSTNAGSPTKISDPALWKRIDAVVLGWIYSTISMDLVSTVMTPGSTAEQAWTQLEDIFSDNRNSRALFLQQEFSKIKLEDFPDISSYCQNLKSLSDQLNAAGAPVSNDQMVLQLISGLTEAYDTVGTQLRHCDKLPPFHKARSMLVLEETARARKSLPPPESASLAVAHPSPPTTSPQSHQQPRPPFNRGRSFFRGGRNGGRNYRGRGGRNPGRNYGIGFNQPYGQSPWYSQSSPWAFIPPWASPSCTYPTAPWGKPQSQHHSSSQSGILGPRPSPTQAHVAQTCPNFVPTDIAEAMHTMTIAPPPKHWHMDTGATSHMTANEGFTNGEAYYEM